MTAMLTMQSKFEFQLENMQSKIDTLTEAAKDTNSVPPISEVYTTGKGDEAKPRGDCPHPDEGQATRP